MTNLKCHQYKSRENKPPNKYIFIRSRIPDTAISLSFPQSGVQRVSASPGLSPGSPHSSYKEVQDPVDKEERQVKQRK